MDIFPKLFELLNINAFSKNMSTSYIKAPYESSKNVTMMRTAQKSRKKSPKKSPKKPFDTSYGCKRHKNRIPPKTVPTSVRTSLLELCTLFHCFELPPKPTLS